MVSPSNEPSLPSTQGIQYEPEEQGWPDSDSEHEDGDGLAHYVHKKEILESALTGLPVVALCGYVWVPLGGNPDRFPTCANCQEIYDALPRGEEDDYDNFEATTEESPDTEDEDVEIKGAGLRHYVYKDDILMSVVTGLPSVALCGYVWVPQGDTDRAPICSVCQEIYDGLTDGDEQDSDD